MTAREQDLYGALEYLLEQVEEDIPTDSRLKHMRIAINEARYVLRETE